MISIKLRTILVIDFDDVPVTLRIDGFDSKKTFNLSAEYLEGNVATLNGIEFDRDSLLHCLRSEDETITSLNDRYEFTQDRTRVTSDFVLSAIRLTRRGRSRPKVAGFCTIRMCEEMAKYIELEADEYLKYVIRERAWG